MNTKQIILICLIAIIATCVLCGNLMLKNTTNPNNCKNITLADGTTLAIPSEFTITKPFSNHIESDGFYYTNNQLESKDWGWIHIEYKNDPVETMIHGSNSTKATDSDNDGVYEFDVFDSNGHKVMRITGSNPAIVESIGKSVKFNTNETTKIANNTTVEKISNDNIQQLPKDTNNKDMDNDIDTSKEAYEKAAANKDAEAITRMNQAKMERGESFDPSW